MADDLTLRFRLLGEDAGAGRALKNTAQNVDELGGKLDGLKATGAAAGAATGAALVGGLTATMDAERATDKLAAQLGASGGWAQDLGQVAGDLYGQGLGESMTDVTTAVRSVLHSGLLPEDATTDQIKNITAKVHNLATTFDQDLGGTSAAVGQMLRTGLARNADEALDILTRGFQEGGDKAGDLLDTLNEYGTQFRKAGLDGTTAMGLISQGLRAGARDSDIVADAVKEFTIRAVDGSKKTADGFRTIGLDAHDMAARIGKGGSTATAALDLTLDRLRAIPDPVARSQAAVALFGTQAEDLGQALFALDPSTAVSTLGEVSGAADRMGKTLNDNATTKLEAVRRQLAQGFAEAAAGVVTWAQQHQTAAVLMVTVLGTLAAAVLTARTAVTLYRSGLILATAATRSWTAAQWLWNAALAVNPIYLVTAAIIALIAAVVLIATRTRWFQQLWSFTWRNATAAASSTWSWITTNWPSLLGAITGPIGAAGLFITRNWSRITTSFTSAKSRVAGAFSGFFTPLLTGFRSVMNTIIRGWNSLRFTMPSIDTRLPGVGKVGGFSVGVPSIPYLATGGIVTEPTLALLGERGPEAVIPLPRAQDPSPTVVTVHVTGFVGSSRELADAINRALAGNEALGLVPSRRGRWA